MKLTADLKSMEYLLHNTQRIVEHHNKLLEARGEQFNLFSVLDIEARENKTHSAFLAELLNPKGTHLCGSVFLELFLKILEKEVPQKDEAASLLDSFINPVETEVIKEFSIGKRNDIDKEGGRLDIYIKNGTNCICIENKIYALDQEAQIERYCSFNKEGENTVFYLTLRGKDPHKSSRGKLKSGEHFFNISYRDHILEWLELCLREVPNLTSVREAINQYILLIKKLTHQLNMEQRKELNKLMAANLEESRFIADHYEKMVSDYKEKFRKDVEKRLKKELSANYEVQKERNISAKFSKIAIKHKDWISSNLLFGLEPFSGTGNGDGHLFIGLLDGENRQKLEEIPNENKINNWWKHSRPILTEAGNRIKLNDLFTLKKLCKPDNLAYNELINLVVKQSKAFIEAYEDKVSAFVVKEKKSKL